MTCKNCFTGIRTMDFLRVLEAMLYMHYQVDYGIAKVFFSLLASFRMNILNI